MVKRSGEITWFVSDDGLVEFWMRKSRTTDGKGPLSLDELIEELRGLDGSAGDSAKRQKMAAAI